MIGHFVKTPNLPENRVKAVFLGEKYAQLSSALNNMGIMTINIKANYAISPNVSYHADMSIFHGGRNQIILSKHIDGISQLCDKLKKMGFNITITDKPDGEKYPADIQLNACLLGDLLFHKRLHRCQYHGFGCSIRLEIYLCKSGIH